MHYYNFNIGDYTSHTRGLSLLEDLAYRRIMDEYYLSEHPLKGSSTDVARVIGMREQVDEVDFVLNKYFKNKGGFWVHERIEKELNNYKDKIIKAQKAGQASAASRRKLRKNKQAINNSLTNDEQMLNVSPTNQEPITNNQEKKKSRKKENVVSKKSKPISPDWTPSETTIQWALKQGATENLIFSKLVPEFVTYFTDTGEKKKSWNSAFVRNPVVKTSIGRFRAAGGGNAAGKTPSGHSPGQAGSTQSPAAQRNQKHRDLYKRVAEEAAAEAGMDSGHLRTHAASV